MKKLHQKLNIFRKTKFISIIFCYMSNIWLSEKLGVSQATVSKWMTNFSQPNLETLIKISKVLNVEVSELIRTDDVHIDIEV